MKRFQLLVVGCVLAHAWLMPPVYAADAPAADRPAVGSSASPNAAVIHWQAFAAMPTFDGEQKQQFEAATKSITEPVTDDLRPLVAQFATALHELHRARAISHCDWQLDYDAGPQLLLPHLQQARNLSRAALLRARLRFAAGEIEPAVADIVATLKLARDCGSSPLLISLLVDVAIEKSATEVLAANLPRLKPEQLDALTLSLKQLPPSASLADGIRMEARSFGNWIERLIDSEAAKLNDSRAGGKLLRAIFQKAGLNDKEPNADDAEGQRRWVMIQTLTEADVRETLRRMRADYEEMAKIASLDYPEQAQRWAEFEVGLSAASKLTKRDDLLRQFSVLLLPATYKVYDRAEELQVRRRLLLLAVEVQRNGPAALQASDTVGKGTVEHHATDNGFELRYAAAGKLEVLRVGDSR